MKPDNLTSAQDQKNDKVSDPNMSNFFTVTEKWGFTTPQQMVLLGMPRRSVFYKWRNDILSDIPHNTRMRISYVSDIDKALREIFDSEAQLINWISQANSVFDDQSPIEVMLNGQMQDLQNVRKHLSERHD